ncbi:MAG: PEGA domain-containing protein [Deltaproteobacteria bacterium]|nr:PEGA domain-containing protein [Deltaproteobacteria bacterium]
MKSLLNFFFTTMLFLCSSTALASESTIILGLTTLDGDDAFANALTAELREQAAKIDAWQVSSREVSLSQISLAYGCEEYDDECLLNISKGLKANRVIFGVIRRTSNLEQYDFRVTLNLFDADLGSIENSVTEVLPPALEDDEQGLGSQALRLLQKLAGIHESKGTIVVNSNLQVAEVRLDDVPIGQLKDGTLVIENVTPGTHRIEVRKEGYASYQESAAVAEDQTTYITSSLNLEDEGQEEPIEADELDTVAPGEEDSLDWLGWTLIGASGLSVAGAIVSWVWIDSIDNDETFNEYREIVGKRNPNATDVCDEVNRYIYAESETSGTAEEKAKQQDVQVMCYRADVLEVLQYVFIGTAVITAGFGAYILISGDDSDAAEAKTGETSLAVTPSVGRESAFITATLTF